MSALRRNTQRLVRVQAFSLTTVFLGACATFDSNVRLMHEAVTPISVGDAARVEAVDLTEVLLRAGLSASFILEHGPSISNALATGGGAQIRDGKSIAALVSVSGENLFVASLANGTFVHPLITE